MIKALSLLAWLREVAADPVSIRMIRLALGVTVKIASSIAAGLENACALGAANEEHRLTVRGAWRVVHGAVRGAWCMLQCFSYDV